MKPRRSDPLGRLLLNLPCVLVIAGCLAALVLLGTGCASRPVPMLRTPASTMPLADALPVAEAAARATGGVVHRVHGPSMLPVLSADALAVTEPADFATLRAGDIVVYRDRAGVLVVHRLYEYRSRGDWLALGDNNSALDHEPVTPANYAGRVWAIFYVQAL
jgi:signal peptidase I